MDDTFSKSLSRKVECVFHLVLIISHCSNVPTNEIDTNCWISQLINEFEICTGPSWSYTSTWPFSVVWYVSSPNARAVTSFIIWAYKWQRLRTAFSKRVRTCYPIRAASPKSYPFSMEYTGWSSKCVLQSSQTGNFIVPSASEKHSDGFK